VLAGAVADTGEGVIDRFAWHRRSSSTHPGLVDASHLDLLVLNERLYGHDMHRLVRYKVSEPLGVGKVAEVVYACRGQKMMDSVSRRPRFTRFRDAGFRPAADLAAGNPVSPVRQRGTEASGI